jgi:hypothetical protein
MAQRYSVTPHPVETLLTWVKSKEIAIPEIQRPFVWEAVQVRDLLDSLYQGYPVGYLISWRNPTVKLKDGTPAAGKRILIDGQQRVTALMAALLLREAPLAMMAALSRACRDRRININVRMILARDYENYRQEARWALESERKWNRTIWKARNRSLRMARMKKPGLKNPNKGDRG